MKRFLFILDYYFKRWSSADAFFHALALGYARAGHRVVFAVPVLPVPAVLKRFQHTNIEFVELRGWRADPENTHSRRRLFHAVRDLLRKAHPAGFDVIALHYCAPEMAIAVVLGARLRGARPRICLHVRNEVRAASRDGVRRWLSLHLSRLRLASGFVDAVVPIYQGARGLLYEKRIPERKLHVIANGVDLTPYRDVQTRAAVFREFGIPPVWRLVIYVGNLLEAKGLRELFCAFKAVVGRAPETGLLLAGEGPIGPELEQQAAQEGFADHVFWAGLRNDVPRLLCAADMLVLPSYSEAFGFVNIEAGAAGLPVVATTVGGVPEVIVDGQTGLLVAPRDAQALADAMARLLASPEVARAMGAAARQRVAERFSLERMLHDYAELYGVPVAGSAISEAAAASAQVVLPEVVFPESVARPATVRPLSLLFVIDYNIQRGSTFDTFFRRLALRYAEGGGRVTFAVPIRPASWLVHDFAHSNIRFVELPSWRADPADAKSARRIRSAARDLVRQVRLRDFDLIGFHFCDPAFVVAVRARCLGPRGRPVLSFHQHNEVRLPAGSWPRRLLSRRLSKLRVASWLTDAIVPVYAKGRDALLAKGVVPRKLEVIYNGVDLSRFETPELTPVKACDFGLPAAARVVLFVGSLIEAKGLRELFAAFAGLTDVPGACLLLVGDGHLRGELEGRVRADGLSGRIAFAGVRADVPSLMHMAYVLVLPTYSESFGLVNIEAGAAGLPVVATTVGGVPEAVIDGETGLLVAPGDAEALGRAIRRLLENPAEARAMGEAGRRRARELFSLDKTIDGYVQLYDRLIAAQLSHREAAKGAKG